MPFPGAKPRRAPPWFANRVTRASGTRFGAQKGKEDLIKGKKELKKGKKTASISFHSWQLIAAYQEVNNDCRVFS
jgi:hypothetical protein